MSVLTKFVCVLFVRLTIVLLLSGGRRSALVRIDVLTFVAMAPVGVVDLGTEGLALRSVGVAPMKSAIRDANAQYGNTTFTMSLTVLDTRVSCLQMEQHVAFLASEYYYKRTNQSDILVFITPGCGEQDELNKLVSGWNVPLINSLARIKASTLRERTLSPTYLSTAHIGRDDFGEPLSQLLLTFKWTSIFVVADWNAVQGFERTSRSVMAQLAIISNRKIYAHRFDSAAQTIDWNGILTSFSRVSRVCLFFGYDKELITLLSAASLRTMTNDDYVYITLTYYSAAGFARKVFSHVDVNASITIKQAIRTLLILAPVDRANTVTDEMSGLTLQWQSETLKEFGMSYGDMSRDTTAASYLLGDYQAVAVLAEVLNASLADSIQFNAKDGRQLTKQFLNRTFETRLGDVAFDERGVQLTDVTIQDYDVSMDCFKPTMIYEAKSKVLRVTNEIDWGQSDAPANEPVCGYTGSGSACQPKNAAIAGASCSVVLLSICCAIVLWLCRQSRKYRQSNWRLSGDLLLLSRFSLTLKDVSVLRIY